MSHQGRFLLETCYSDSFRRSTPLAYTVQFLLRHGYIVLFGFVFAEQIGLPIPSLPALLAMGALIGTHHSSFVIALLVATIAAVLGDLTWYELGRFRGHAIVNLLCRISLEPDSCVRRTENLFVRRGARALLIAKFIPGLSTVAPPLAGMLRMRIFRFLMWDGGGAVLWAGSFITLGYVFRTQLEDAALVALRLGAWLLVLLFAVLVAYVLLKYIQRRRFIRELRIARITPEELFQRVRAGEDVVIVDLRHSIDFADQTKIAGAIHIPPEELEKRSGEIPRDRDIVLYCT